MEKANQSSSNHPISGNSAQQQNININISYNLNTHKIPKSILGAKKALSKSKKVPNQSIQGIGNQFFSNLALNAINQGKKVVKKQNLSKKSNQVIIPSKQPKIAHDKKNNFKKKKSKQINSTQINQDLPNPVVDYYNPFANNSKDFLKRNIQSPDIFKVENNRKIKTQASCYQVGSTLKKGKKQSLHPKDLMSNPVAKNSKMNNWMKQSGYNFLTNKAPCPLIAKRSLSSKTPKNKKSIFQLKQKQKRLHTQQNQFPIHQSLQARHNKSCMLYSTKKQGLITEPNLVQTAQHIISTFATNNSNKIHRKRAQSAYAFSKNDKQLVSKIINMSTISSELGSSQLISTERMKSARNGIARKKLDLKVDQFAQFNHYQPFNEPSKKQNQFQNKNQSQQYAPGNALRQYLNSIDMRIIKNIQDDTALLLQKQQKQQKLQQNLPQKKLLKIKPSQSSSSERHGSEDINQSTTENKDMVSFYSKLFSNALNNKKILEEQQKYLDSANQSSFKQSISQKNDHLNLRKQRYFINQFQQQSSQLHSERSELKQVYQFVKEDKNQKHSLKLNFKHYKDLLDNQASKQKNGKQQKNDKQQTNQIKQVNGRRQMYQQIKKISKDEKCDKDFEFILTKNNKKQKQQLFQKDQKQIIDLLLKEDLLSEQDKQKGKNINYESQNIQDNGKQFGLGNQFCENFQQLSNNDKFYQNIHSFQQRKDFLHQKQSQVERWNNINKILHKKINQKDDQQKKNSQIMEQLIRQSNLNKKWIEQQQQPNLLLDEEESRSEQKSQNLQQRNTKLEQKKENYQLKLQKVDTNVTSAKSPKLPNRNKRNLCVEIQAQDQQVCWQYNPDELQKQIQNYQIQCNSQKVPKICSNNVHNSPNNYSEDGNGSGEQEYDSKKYSQVSLFKDQILEQTILSQQYKNSNRDQKQKQNNHDKNQRIKNLIDSLDQDEEDQQISCQQKQINGQNRWIHHNNILSIEKDEDEGRIRKFKFRYEKKQDSQRLQSFQNNYLECDLSNFGVNHEERQSQIEKHGVSTSFEQNGNPTFQQKLKRHDDLVQINEVLASDNQEQKEGIEDKHNSIIQKKEIKQTQTNQHKDVFAQIRKKRLTHIVQDIILEMIRQFARDISYILKKSTLPQSKNCQQEIQENTSPFKNYKQLTQQSQLSPFYQADEHFEISKHQDFRQQQIKKNSFVGKCFGIQTSFSAIQKYLKQFKLYLLQNQILKQSMIKNVNKDIGPNSLQILSYLRPQYDNTYNQDGNQNQNANQGKFDEDQNCEDQDGLFVVPSQAFSDFENYLEQKIEQKNKVLGPQNQIILTQKQKRNTNFFHRGIYQSWNQFLDYQRPYGINGKPYEWIQQRKRFRQVKIQDLQRKLQKGIDKLLQAISLPSGIIYDKFDLPATFSDLSQEQKIFLNEERLSRMLAIELFESEQTWINYNDQMAELLVELSRIVEERIFFQLSTQLKRMIRKRKTLITGQSQESSDEEMEQQKLENQDAYKSINSRVDEACRNQQQQLNPSTD